MANSPGFNAISLTANVSGILPSANGGTANGFTKFTGPTTSEKTFTLPNASDTIACLGTVGLYTAQQNFGTATLTSTSNSIAWNANTAQVAVHTATENTTLANPTNMVNGGTYIFKFIQHASSAKTLAFGSAYKWPNGVAPTVSTGASAVDIMTFWSDGTNMYGTYQQAFA